MKRINLLLLLIMPLLIMAQQYPITSINISLPQNPDASTNKWTTAASMLNITAMTKMVNGKIDPSVEGSKVMVSIKKAGSIVCGNVNISSAPQANFNSSSKVWSGNAAVALLGQDCTLQPGQYEICVQFFGGPRNAAFSEQKCKAFTIRGMEQQSFQAPQALMPTNGTAFKEADLQKPISFRWTPIYPRPQEPTTYRLKVWQLMQGQNGTQAMRVNQPIITKDIDNITQATISNIITGPCKPPYLCEFVWNVQALNREGKAIGENNPTSETVKFSYTNQSVKETQIELVSPTNKSVIENIQTIKFSWKVPKAENQEAKQEVSYKIQIIEVNGDQSIENAFRTNKPIFEKDSTYIIRCCRTNKPIFEKDSPFIIVDNPNINPVFKKGKSYAWRVETKGKENKGSGESEIWIFKMGTAGCGTVTYDTTVSCKGWNEKTGLPIYSISITLKNQPTNGTLGCKVVYSSLSILNGGGIISNTSTLPITILPNGSETISLTYSPPNSATTSVEFRINGNWNDPLNNSINIPVKVELPNCKENDCNCGTWGPLRVPNGPKIDLIECGKEIVWKCKVPFKFSNNYTCKPNNKLCQASTSWSISKDGKVIQNGKGPINDSFTPTENGVYTLTLLADCGGLPCPPCEYKIVVRDCDEDPKCDCGTWGPLNIQNGPKKDSIQCGKEIIWKCKVPFKFSNKYTCKPNNKLCQASTSWSISKDGKVIQNGKGPINDSFTPTENGVYTLTLLADCGGLPCPPCEYKIVVRDCIPDFNCNCGTWGQLRVPNGPKIDLIECGKEIVWKCKVPFKFSNTYSCKPNIRLCQASTSWSISKDGKVIQNGKGPINDSFTPTENGVYTLTLLADCGGLLCPPCEYIIVVRDCDEDPKCDCGKWGPLNVQNGPKIDLIECGKEIVWKCKVPFKFSNNYTCKPNNKLCQASTSWSISKDGKVIQNGKGPINDSFTPIENGVYTLTLLADCGGLPCPPCEYKIVVNDCIPDFNCNCGTWGPLRVPNGPKISLFECGKEIIWKCKVPFKFSNTYSCKPNIRLCQATTSWSISKDGKVIQNGKGPINDSFTPTENGVYTLTLLADCGGLPCPPCEYKIVVRDCDTDPKCDCGKWGNLIVTKGTLITEYTPAQYISWECGTPIKFSNSYTCSPNNKNCQAKTSWSISKSDQILQVGNGPIEDVFTPTENGIYTILFNAKCGELECDTLEFNFVIKNCKPEENNCGSWESSSNMNYITYSGNNGNCGEISINNGLQIQTGVTYSFTAPNYNCGTNSANSSVNYTWFVNGIQVSQGNTLNHTFSQLNNTVSIIASCNEKKCDTLNFNTFPMPSVDTCNNNVNQTFFDSTSFLNSLSNPIKIDFTSYNDTTTMAEINPGGSFPLSCWTRKGITFDHCSSSWNAYLTGNAISISFPPGTYKKAGFTGSTYQGGNQGNYIVKVYSGNCIYIYNFSATPSYFYFGINSPTPIDKIVVDYTTDQLLLTSFTFGN